MSELSARLQQILAGAYRVERELGGGGMSRVFLAQELSLNRKVVVKVLPPEMAAGVNKQRFRRETQLAASLQHPLIVPILTAGVAEDDDGSDLLYYVMPFIEGQSLRERMEQGGALPILECARILRDVADALLRAHQVGVVHRDIKPDNVMLSGKHAMVTDFGIAKAVSSAGDASESGLTQMGMALGTPMYMSPEQAAGDPNTDERADIYSLGVMAYEMLAGKLPFAATTPQGMLAAHVGQQPVPPRHHRSSIPPDLDALVVRCLEKKPADRPQNAEQLGSVLDGIIGSSGRLTPAAVTTPDIARFVQTSSPGRVAAAFTLLGAVLLGGAYLLTIRLGLPDWTMWGAGGLAVLGVLLPASAARSEPGRSRPTWRQTRLILLSGVGMLLLAVGGHSGLRSLGIGPSGTLVTTGQLAENDRVILAQFANSTTDSTLGSTVTELLRIDFAQSPTLSLMEPSQVSAVLRRMELDAVSTLTEAVAAEVAEREGVKAIIAGEIRSIGGDFVVSARLVATTTGETLAASRETADAGGLIEAVDKLSASLRKQVGESLRSIRTDPPLARVTTRSNQALRLFAQADRANNLGQSTRAIALLEDAIREDSMFAMAHRKLAIVLNNQSLDPIRATEAFTRAYELRERLTERERHLAEAAYYSYVDVDLQRSIDAYASLLEKYPTDQIALNNLALNYRQVGRTDDAADLFRRSLSLGGAPAVTYMSATELEFARGALDSSRAVAAQFENEYPDHPVHGRIDAAFASATFDYDLADSLLRSHRESIRGIATSEVVVTLLQLGSVAVVRGRVDESVGYYLDGYDAQRMAGLTLLSTPRDLFRATVLSWMDMFLDNPERAVNRLDRALQETNYASLPFEQRDDLQLATLYARAGLVGTARSFLSDYEAGAGPENDIQARTGPVWGVYAEISMAERRYADAVRELRRARSKLPGCTVCFLSELGEAYAESGQLDSAIVAYQRYLDSPMLYRLQIDGFSLWRVYRGLGAAYEATGQTESALDMYGRLLDLWQNADQSLQPVVDDVRNRVTRLMGDRSN